MTTTFDHFGATTEAKEVTSAFSDQIKGRTFVITGVSKGGIGLATAKSIILHQPKQIVILGRDSGRLEDAKEILESLCDSKRCIESIIVDLASLSSVRLAANEFEKRNINIDVLINNAAIMALPKRQFSDIGIELQFTTNHLGPFLLTELLLERFNENARIVNLTSNGHIYCPIRFTDINFEKPKSMLPEEERLGIDFHSLLNDFDGNYNGWQAYGQSKTANILHSIYINNNLSRKGLCSYAVHPGSIATNLTQHQDENKLNQVREAYGTTRKTLEQGASTTLVAALDPSLQAKPITGRVYMADCQFSEKVSAYAIENDNASRLYHLSKTLIDL